MNTPTDDTLPDGFNDHIPDYSAEDIQYWNESLFASQLCNPIEWFERSRALIATARITKKQSEKIISHSEKHALEQVCSMLYGLSLENLFKAHWILNKYGAPHIGAWEPDVKFPKEIIGHNLVKLAGLIELPMTEKRRYALTYFTEAATWSGRYPCPLKADDSQSAFFLPGTFEIAEKIYRKLKVNFTISD
ncbi:hypothetical protein [Pseudomonas mediterranea]|uniref:hypothetical protein n=1 Tax=Pseudomonas mediterranea TaxID=183795 RepID=UPI001D6BEEFD|nr:hypothetical protein [Pseudomonas mediterranea]CAH0154651.1 hypothetical protein SRABI112_00776 [Pseudomonas mediterranea]